MSERGKQRGEGADASEIQEKHNIYFFQFSFFVRCFTHDPSNGVAFFVTARVTAQRLHTPTTRQAQKQRVPGIFPRLEDGYSLDWRMDIPSIGGWIFPRLEDGYFGRAFGKPGRGTRILLTTVKRSKNSKN